MATSDELRRRFRTLEADLRRRASKAAGRVRDRRTGSSVNIAARTNIVSAENVGAPNASRGASSVQRIRIRQHDGETSEESETTRSP